MRLQAFRKEEGQKQWTKCPEWVALLPETLLPGYNTRTVFDLPPVAQVVGPDPDQNCGEGMHVDSQVAQNY
jgi:hypothetical protein